MFKFTYRIFLLSLLLLFGGATLAKAQASASGYFGLGTARDSSNGQDIDGFGDFGPSLGGVFITFGGDLMAKQSLGFGAEYSWHASRINYAPQLSVTARPIFYDFNAIWHPYTKHSKVIPEFQGGIGGADVKFYESESGCVLTACSTVNQYLASSDHFQVHFAGGVRIYVTSNIFVKPQVDVHYVHNFEEFGSNWAPEYTVSVGYTSGEH